MKKTLIILLAALLCITAFAGEEGQFGVKHIVKGLVVDSLTRSPEPSAVLQFFQKGSDSPLAFTTTDLEGNFNITIDGVGDYKLLFSNIGRKPVELAFVLAEEEIVDLGTIEVSDDVKTLAAGSVVAQRPLVKMEVDKMSYDVANDVDSKSSTVLDMLRKVPMVTVDGQDNISVNGSSSFMVTIDGKPNPMFSSNASQIFKMMPASAVESIEVITNPGVKYDAEGVGGVLNIKLARAANGSKASTDGQYGTVRLIGGNRGGGAGLYYSLQKSKFTMSLNGNGVYQVVNGVSSDVTRTQNTALGPINTKSFSNIDQSTPFGMGNLSASYEIDSLNLLTATFGVMAMDASYKTLGQTSVGAFSYNSDTDGKLNTGNYNLTVDYQHNWAKVPERSFTLSYQFTGSPNFNGSTNKYSAASEGDLLSLIDRRSDSRSLSMDNTIQADFTTPIAKGQKLSAGAKLIFRHNSSDSKLYLWNGSDFAFDAPGSLLYHFYNNIAAAYGEWNGTFGKFGLKAGVRYEYTMQKYTTDSSSPFTANYGDLVPTASIQYSFNPMSNLGLSYNMRISRPGISYLNPYVDTTDPTSKTYGNSSLNTEHAHNLNLVYNLYTPKFMMNLTGSYSFNNDGISQYSFYDSMGILNTSYGNIVSSNTAGLSAFMNVNLGSRTRIFMNANTSYSKFFSSTLDQSNSGLSYSLALGGQYTLPSDIRLSANLMNMGKSYNLQGYNTGMNMVMASASKDFFNDKLNVSVVAATHIGKGPKMAMTIHSEGKDFVSDMVNSIPLRIVNISVSYSFGSARGIQVKKAGKSISNDEQLNKSNSTEQMGGSTSLMGM